MSSIEKYYIFDFLKQEIIDKIKIACVLFGKNAIFVTKDDEIYALGENANNFICEGGTIGNLQPRKIEALCKKRICNFSYGGGHFVALSENGEIYTWGINNFCQLGNGTANFGSIPTQISTNLFKKAIDISCGLNHTLVLNDNGEVYAWGDNRCGQIGYGSVQYQSIPIKVNFGTNEKFISITCCMASSFALLENGQVYAWGDNSCGQLGINHNTNQVNPCKVIGLDDVVIRKIVCGYAHVLALAYNGSLYSWGLNSSGQVGNGLNSSQPIKLPVKIAENLGRFADIAANVHKNISVGLTYDNKYYIWGYAENQFISQLFTVPTEVRYNSIHEIFACSTTPQITCEPITLSSKGNQVLDSLCHAFNDSKTSDFKFIVDNQSIHVHKAILKIRCEHFRTMFQKHWDEDGKDEIEITQFSYPVYYAFLQYLYTDEVNLLPEAVIDVIDLLDLANCYFETDLKYKCERLIKCGISIDNALIIYDAAIKYDIKNLEDYCFNFALAHLEDVVQSEAFQGLREFDAKFLIIRAAKMGAFRRK